MVLETQTTEYITLKGRLKALTNKNNVITLKLETKVNESNVIISAYVYEPLSPIIEKLPINCEMSVTGLLHLRSYDEKLEFYMTAESIKFGD